MSKSEKTTTANNYGVLWAAGLIFFISLVAVSIHFLGAELPNCNEAKEPSECKALYWVEYRASWGQFGDFMGGMVNPFIGLLTIYLLVTTIAQQGRALDQTEKALDHANKALEQNASALELTRTEIQLAQAEIKIGREIQQSTELALKEQIEIARGQNNFANYYKHLEEFMIHFREWHSKYKFINFEIHERRLHLYLYPKSNTGNRDTNKAIVRRFLAVLIEYIEMFQIDKHSDSDDILNISKSIADFDEKIGSIFDSKVKFEEISDTNVGILARGHKPAPALFGKTKNALNDVQVKLRAISELLSFDVNLNLNDDLIHVFSVLDDCIHALDSKANTEDILAKFNDEKEPLIYIKIILNTTKSSLS
ncbi:MAG: hypothetical protein Q7T48_22120 [Cellvibrio sp.]|uniref:hypothetical protein n=1 Tax=Cellvibrio sp. TaxID=1965322 RepID=UPI00271F9ED5|nr:hypothetical protein [Cellvibrio sp.]